MDAVVARGDPARMVELVIVGTVLGEALFGALRLLAQEHASAVRLGLAPEAPAALAPGAPTTAATAAASAGRRRPTK